jgi:hydroxypyruvate reductase
VAKVYAALVREIRDHQQPFRPPVALISGGECTVTVRGNGRGGRCAEFLTSLAVELDGMPDVYALAADTDGIDGTEDNAGALLLPDSPARAAAKGISAKQLLANNDGYSYFEALGDLLVTGPTRTNVNDYRVILVL